MFIKCIGCYNLLRQEILVNEKPLVIYNCPGRFPYACALSGLLRPGKGTQKAAEDCPEDPHSHCVLCPSTEVTHYGHDIATVCKDHSRAWSEWLDQHPERRAYFSPRGRGITRNWVEVFREFIEDMRSTVEGEP